MSQLSALLGVLQTHAGDELILETGQSPTFLKRGEALRLFLRAIPDDRHQMMVREVVTDTVRENLAASGRVSLEHDEGENGRYQVHLSGAGAERMRFVHLPDDDDTACLDAGPVGERHEVGGVEGLVGVDHVQAVVAGHGLFLSGGLAGADVHAAVDLHRVRRHDLGPEALRDRQRRRGLARGGRPSEQQHRWKSVVHTLSSRGA
mgnify:CR=1 FL=1